MSKKRSRRMRDVEDQIGQPMEKVLTGYLKEGLTAPSIAVRINEDHDLKPPVSGRTIYNWFDYLDMEVGRAVRADGKVHFVDDPRLRD